MINNDRAISVNFSQALINLLTFERGSVSIWVLEWDKLRTPQKNHPILAVNRVLLVSILTEFVGIGCRWST